jgi:hypothetical protein
MLLTNLLSDAHIAELAELYRDTADVTPSLPVNQFRKFVAMTMVEEHLSYWNGLRIQHVTGQPYESADELRSEMFEDKVLRISTDYNESDLLGETVNLMFRAAHDMHHAREPECGFFLDGEICAFVKFAEYTDSVLYRQILFSEIVLQVIYLRVYGSCIDVQKVVLVDYDKYILPILRAYELL